MDDYRLFSPAFGEDVREVTLESSVAARQTVGGTAPARVREAIATRTASVAAAREWVEAQRSPDADAGVGAGESGVPAPPRSRVTTVAVGAGSGNLAAARTR